MREWKMQYGQKCEMENAVVENAEADRRGGKCRSRLAVWKAEPILYSDTTLRCFLKFVFRLLSER